MSLNSIATAGCLLLLVAGCASEPPAPGPSLEDRDEALTGAPGIFSRPPDGSPARLALLVGINTYPNLSRFSQLEGAVNDVERIRTLLTTRYEFPPENVRVLTNEDATYDNILAAFRNHLVANTRAGDIVVFHYSGHGSQLDDDPGGDELDGVDETIVPSDSDRHGTRDIRDDEINALIAELNPDARVTLIFDSCHSGTASRDLEGGQARRIDRDSLLTSTPSSVTRGPAGTESLGTQHMNYVLLSGARSNQQAKELKKDGRAYGAMTYFLTEALNETDSSMTYADLRDVLQGQISAHFANQSPQLEGPSTDFYVFSETSSLAEPHVRISVGSNALPLLQAGRVHGMTEGSVFEVYAPGTKHFATPNEPIARVKVARVEAFTAQVEVLSGGPIPDAARAVEREHVYANLQMNLRYEGLSASPTLQALKDELAALTHIHPVPETADDFDLRLFERDDSIHIKHDDVVFSTPVPVQETDAVDHLVTQVQQWAKWFNIRALDDAAPDNPVVLHLRFDAPDDDADREWNEVAEGDGFWYAFENKSDKDLYITGIALFSTGAIQPFYPYPPGAGALLKAGTKSPEIRIDNLSVADGRPYTRDILKVFATTTPVDLSSLIQGKIRGGLNDPLQNLLRQATQGSTRDFNPTPMGDWFITQQAFVVRRKMPAQAL